MPFILKPPVATSFLYQLWYLQHEAVNMAVLFSGLFSAKYYPDDI